MHSRSRKTTDPRIPTTPGRTTSEQVGFSRTGAEGGGYYSIYIYILMHIHIFTPFYRSQPPVIPSSELDRVCGERGLVT